jgi:hypothetical protein
VAAPNFFEWSILICSSRSNWLGNAIAHDLQVYSGLTLEECVVLTLIVVLSSILTFFSSSS